MLAANQAQQPLVEKKASRSPVQDLIDRGKQLRDSGHVREAISVFGRARSLAHQLHDSEYEARSMVLTGSAQILDFQYRPALKSLEQAVQIGKGDFISGMASSNMSNLYWQLGDFATAEADSKYAIECFKRIVHPDNYAKTGLIKALMIHASICFQLGKVAQGHKDYDEALARARSQGDVQLQAFVWDKQGLALMMEDNITEANDAFHRAYALSKSSQSDIDGLAFEKEHLAELQLKQRHPDFKLALTLINDAFTMGSPGFKSSPQYYPINIRGRILLGSGDRTAALSEFKKAIDLADQWRRGALPGDATNSQTVAALQQVYADYAHLAAQMALENTNNSLAVNALQAIAENRAASLREQLRVAYENNDHLPEEYLEKLGQLQAAQAQVTLGQNTSKDQAELMRIRLDISKLENKIGINSEKISESGEKIPRQILLRDIQHTFGREQVLLSISLGKDRSYVWAVTAGKVSLSRIAGEDELKVKAKSFAEAVRTGRATPGEASDLTGALFAGLPPDVWNRSEWMIVADGPLLSGVPFCALTDLSASHKLLIEDKSIRFLPSEFLLADHRAIHLKERFVGIGDPIYNQADTRIARTSLLDAKTLSDSITLARLVGSGKEVRSAAIETRSADAVLLTGAKATRAELGSALSHDAGIVHFAVHVVSPPDQPQEAALALSLKNGLPELLTPEVVTSFHTPGSLVVLSGCSSGQGKVLPGAGLVGLSRAWLLAGAAAVVVSNWPTPDDSGKFFTSFYGHLGLIKTGDTAQRAALALRRTQLDMLHSTGYQTSPSFWGAFAVISKE